MVGVAALWLDEDLRVSIRDKVPSMSGMLDTCKDPLSEKRFLVKGLGVY